MKARINLLGLVVILFSLFSYVAIKEDVARVSAATTYSLTITNGSGSGSYAPGETVTIVSSIPSAGKQFDHWTGDTGYLSGTSSTRGSVISIIMPSADIALAANYIDTIVYGESSLTMPTTIRVYRNATGTIDTVDFKYYVKNVMPSEWGMPGWPAETLQAGAMAVTMYGWYRVVNHAYPKLGYDVDDSTNDQIYRPNTQRSYTDAAVDAIWGNMMLRGGRIFLPGYDAGTEGSLVPLVPNRMSMAGAAVLGFEGKDWQQILHYYYDPYLGAITVSPISEDATYALAVTNGTGSGSYFAGTKVNISADAPVSGKAFDKWTGDTACLSSMNSSTATVVMPSSVVSLTATYKDVVSPAKSITAFSFDGLTPAATGKINETEHTVAVAVPFGTNITALTPTIVSSGSVISPGSGVVQNFTAPVAYTVTAADNSTQRYVVTVTVSLASTDAALSSLSLSGGTLTPSFAREVYSYAVSVANGTSFIAVNAVPNESHARVEINGSVATSKSVPLDLGPNLIHINVYAQDTSFGRAYDITITRATVSGGSGSGSSNPDNVDSSAPYPTGTLIKITSSNKVYVVVDGKKKWISTPEVFEQLGYDWAEIKVIADTELDGIADYEDNLIRQIGDYKVLLVVNGIKRHILNPEIFIDYGFLWTDVRDVSKAVMDKYQSACLLKESGKDGIYYVNPKGIRKLIPTDEVFKSYDDRYEDVQVASRKELESYPLSDLIRLNEDPEVYLVQGDVKRYVPSLKIAQNHNLDLSRVISVNQYEFNWYKDGVRLE